VFKGVRQIILRIHMRLRWSTLIGGKVRVRIRVRVRVRFASMVGSSPSGQSVVVCELGGGAWRMAFIGSSVTASLVDCASLTMTSLTILTPCQQTEDSEKNKK